MAWETRGNGRYYYTAERIGGRVVKSYVGSHRIAQYAAALDQSDRETAARERECGRHERETAEATRQAVEVACQEAGQLASFLIEQAGYHQHDRGRWRRKRRATRGEGEAAMGNTVFKDGTKEADVIAEAAAQIPKTPEERHRIIVAAMGSKDPKKKAQAIAILREYPDSVTSHYLNEVKQTVCRILGEEASEVGQQLLLNEAAQMRRDLRGGRPASEVPYAERLLIERVIACRFLLVQAEDACKGNMTLALGEYRQRCSERAQRRYLAAIKTLAEVRRLALPIPPAVSVALPGSTQVNIAEKQVNVAQSGAAQENSNLLEAQ